MHIDRMHAQSVLPSEEKMRYKREFKVYWKQRLLGEQRNELTRSQRNHLNSHHLSHRWK